MMAVLSLMFFFVNDHHHFREHFFDNFIWNNIWGGANFQRRMFEINIHKGGLFGNGIGTYRWNNYLPVPNYHNFPLVLICYEFGFVGAFLLIVILNTLIYLCLKGISGADSERVKVLLFGLLIYILFHIVGGIGTSIQLLPIMEIPLPGFTLNFSHLIITLFIIVWSMWYYFKDNAVKLVGTPRVVMILFMIFSFIALSKIFYIAQIQTWHFKF